MDTQQIDVMVADASHEPGSVTISPGLLSS